MSTGHGHAMAASTSPFQFSAPIRVKGTSVAVRLSDGEPVELRPLGPDEPEAPDRGLRRHVGTVTVQPLPDLPAPPATRNGLHPDCSRRARPSGLAGIGRGPAGGHRPLRQDHAGDGRGRPRGGGRPPATRARNRPRRRSLDSGRGLGDQAHRGDGAPVEHGVPAAAGADRAHVPRSAGQLEGAGELRLLDPPRIDRPAVARLAWTRTAGAIGSWILRSAAGE